MSNFEYFDGDIGGRNHYFALNENEILEVSRVEADEHYRDYNPRNEAQSTFITFDGWAPDQNTPDESDFEDMPRMAEYFGVPEELVYLPETEEGTSWGEIAEAEANLPYEIITAAENQGTSILAVYGDVYHNPAAGFSTDPDHGPFAGFIYDETGKMDHDDLAADIDNYNAWLVRDTYQTRVYEIDPEKNEINMTPSEPTGTFYGYDADMNGLSDEIDTDMCLGSAYDIKDFASKTTAQEIAEKVQSEVNPDKYFTTNLGGISGGIDIFMQDRDHVLAIGFAEEIDDPRDFARSAFLSFDDDGHIAEESPDTIGVETVFDVADHFGVSDHVARAAFEDAGVEGVLQEIESQAEKKGIAMLPVRCDISSYNDKFEEGYPTDGQLPGLIYSDDKDTTVAELSEEVRQYGEYLENNECEYAIYQIVDKFDDKGRYEGLSIDEENPTDGGFLYGDRYTENGLAKIQDLSTYIGSRPGFGDVTYGFDSKTLSKLQKAFDVHEDRKNLAGRVVTEHNEKKAKKEVAKNKNKDKDQNNPDMK